MKRLSRGLLLLMLAGALIACGPPRKSVFPPDVTIQQLVVSANGQWQLTLRIQNNSYGEMQFTALDGSLQIADQLPVRLHTTFKRDIPALSGDVIALQVLPTATMTKALQAVAAKGSAGSLPYRHGQAGAGTQTTRLCFQRYRLVVAGTRHRAYVSLNHSSFEEFA